LLVGAKTAARRHGGLPGGTGGVLVGAGSDQLQGVPLGTDQSVVVRPGRPAGHRRTSSRRTSWGSELQDLVGADIRSGGQLGADLPHHGAFGRTSTVPGDPRRAEHVAGQGRDIDLAWVMPTGQHSPHMSAVKPNRSAVALHRRRCPAGCS